MSIIKKLLVVWFVLKVMVIIYFLISINIPSIPPEISPVVDYIIR
jgi:hypothetical protein